MNPINEGLMFMVVGMGMVFTFLVLMIIVMNVSANVITKYFPDKEEVAQASPSGNNNAKIAAVIAIARAQQ